MKKVKTIYDYFFYKMYKSVEYTSELGGGKFWSEWKASLSMDGIIYFIIISLFIYCKIFFKQSISLSTNNSDVLILVIPVAIFNYFIFNYNDRWKKIICQFDKLPSKKNIIGGWIVFIIVILIIINLIFSYYLLFQRAKQNQTGPYSKEYIEQQKIKDSINDAIYNKKIQEIRDQK